MAGAAQSLSEKTGKEKHIPVMLAEVLSALTAPAPKGGKQQSGGGRAKPESLRDKHILDGTFGNGGYSRAFLDAGAKVLGLDRDASACAAGRVLEAQSGGRFIMRETEFSKLSETAAQAGFAPLDAVVLDIGVSSMQIDEGARGFSFRRDGPLDMRMSGRGVSAAAIVNGLASKDLARIFHFYGEERFAARIARMIEARRRTKPFTATLDLAQAIEALGLHKGEKIHAATRVFQALRIYVNDELNELARALFAAERALKPGGRLIVVSFHSLEDRIVKRFFAAKAAEKPASRHLPLKDLAQARFAPLFKGAKCAGSAEAAANPRARSAKLRAGIRTQAPAGAEDFGLFGLPRLPLLSAAANAALPRQGEQP